MFFIIHIPEKIFTWGIDGNRSGCHPLNENELTIESSYLHCQEKLLGGEASKKQEKPKRKTGGKL